MLTSEGVSMSSRYQQAQLINKIFASTLTCILLCVFALPSPVYAKDIPNTFPDLNTFIETVKNGNANILRGVYVSNVMALAVVQQPIGQFMYVSNDRRVATQFSMVTKMGNVGLLAHSTLAGSLFSNIKDGDQIVLIYGDGHTKNFITQSIQRYQALEPLNPYSHFVDLESQKPLSAEELFNKVYRGRYHLTLQTCIQNNGESSWGRLFILATPTDDNNNIYPIDNAQPQKEGMTAGACTEGAEVRREDKFYCSFDISSKSQKW